MVPWPARPRLIRTQPNPVATETGMSGTAQAINVSEGAVVVRTRLGKDGPIISELPAHVRDGWGTFFNLMPTPAE